MNKGAGRYNFSAELVNAKGEVVATGKEDAYIVDVDSEKIPGGGEIIDIADLTSGFLPGIPAYNAESDKQKYILLAQGDEEFSEIPARIMKSLDGTDGMVTLEVYDNEKCKGKPRKKVLVPRFRYDESTYPFEKDLNLKPELGLKIVGNIIPEVTGNYQLEISHNWVTELHINGEKVMQGKNSVAGGKDGTEPLKYKFVKGKKYKVELISRKPFGRPFTHSAFRWKVPAKSYDVNDLLAKVENGTNLVIIHSPEPVLEALAEKGVIEYKKNLIHGHSWKGGIYFNKPHDIFEGLPQNTPFNWEYQVFTRYFGPRHRSFILTGEEAVVASVSGHQHMVGTALGIVKHGKGQVIFTTLDIAPHLNSEEEPALVAKKLLVNMLKYAAK
ncbi:MAG: hypothetical protein MI922_26530, partial [Bacteroidales bacterium]|nr:hypothetical protein [Bacteroidales bacterium]